MKILQMSPHFSPNVGGVETHLEDLVSALTARKHKVFVLAYQPLQTESRWKIVESDNRKIIFRMPWIRGLFYKFIDKPTFEFLYLFPGLFIVAPFVILLWKPKVLHAHGLVAGVIAIFWKKIFKVRTVISTHNIYNFPATGLYRKIVEWVFNNSDHILCLSTQSADEIRNIVNEKNKVSIFKQWVDLKKFRPLDKISSKKTLGWKERFTVLFVGRLVPEKGILELLKAAELIRKEIKLRIAGSGLLEPRVGKYYIGKISQDKLSLYYSAADIVIVPSTHDEGFGRVVVESLACGTPVIGSNRGAIPQVMNNSVGKLIDVSPVNIKNAIEYFYENRARLMKASKKARIFAESRYAADNVRSIIKSYS